MTSDAQLWVKQNAGKRTDEVLGDTITQNEEAHRYYSVMIEFHERQIKRFYKRHFNLIRIVMVLGAGVVWCLGAVVYLLLRR